MNIGKRIENLRIKMRENNVDVYIVPTADYHQSEYVGDYFKAREFITGFTGSAGTAVVTQDEALLWTDGRYWIQAENELAGSDILLMKSGEPDVPNIKDWILAHLKATQTIGFDGRTLSYQQGIDFEKLAEENNFKINYSIDLIDEIWENRPELSKEPAFILDEKFTGESIESKIKRIRESMKERNIDMHLITSLDDICWMLNIRGNDIAYSPLVLSYAMVWMGKIDLYIDKEKLYDEILEIFKINNIIIHPYKDVYTNIKKLNKNTQNNTLKITNNTNELNPLKFITKNKLDNPSDNISDINTKILIDPNRINFAIYKNIPNSCEIVARENPSVLMKSMKNNIEIENIREAHIKDGVAVTKFIYWLKNNFSKDDIIELDCVKKLQELRSQQDGYIQDSFEAICAYGEHAAIIHYSASKESDVILKPNALFLFDTGGNYFQGSTDITRTVALGKITDEIKHYYTAVLKSMINLSKASFLYGCTGSNLDILAREPIWSLQKDFKHGTGHGVGYLSNIHEAPINIRWKQSNAQQLKEGMITSVEPGIYEDEKFGIRIENEILVQRGENNKYGQFMHFETLTFAPIDLDAININEMMPDEIEWLNNYHSEVYKKISPHLCDEEVEWLKLATKKI